MTNNFKKSIYKRANYLTNWWHFLFHIQNKLNIRFDTQCMVENKKGKWVEMWKYVLLLLTCPDKGEQRAAREASKVCLSQQTLWSRFKLFYGNALDHACSNSNQFNLLIVISVIFQWPLVFLFYVDSIVVMWLCDSVIESCYYCAFTLIQTLNMALLFSLHLKLIFGKVRSVGCFIKFFEQILALIVSWIRVVEMDHPIINELVVTYGLQTTQL